MRIGLVVDGHAEFAALRLLKPRLDGSTGHTLIGPIRAPMHPMAKPAVIARVAAERISELGKRGLDRAVVLLDREDRAECPGDLAISIAQLITPKLTIPVLVVIKDRTFENWLVADIAAFQALPARFTLSAAAIRSIDPNRADGVDAYEILRAASVHHSYHKVQDSYRIFKAADVDRIAANSRSFRRFLRTLEYPAYRTQSRTPVL